jgi:hypothetical protein
MKAQDVIKQIITGADQIVGAYLGDLTDKEMFHRPAPGCNHVNWQLGHLITAEHGIIEKSLPNVLPPLPKGFAEKYASENAKKDDPAAFCNKDELLRVYKEQRAATLAALAKTSETELDRPCEGWTPNVAAVFSGAAGTHWLMHVGQWAVIRRQLGRPPLF